MRRTHALRAAAQITERSRVDVLAHQRGERRLLPRALRSSAQQGSPRQNAERFACEGVRFKSLASLLIRSLRLPPSLAREGIFRREQAPALRYTAFEISFRLLLRKIHLPLGGRHIIGGRESFANRNERLKNTVPPVLCFPFPLLNLPFVCKSFMFCDRGFFKSLIEYRCIMGCVCPKSKKTAVWRTLRPTLHKDLKKFEFTEIL